MGLGALLPDRALRLVLLSDGDENVEEAQERRRRRAPMASDSTPSRCATTRATKPLPSRWNDRLVATQSIELDSGTDRFVLPVDVLPIGRDGD